MPLSLMLPRHADWFRHFRFRHSHAIRHASAWCLRFFAFDAAMFCYFLSRHYFRYCHFLMLFTLFTLFSIWYFHFHFADIAISLIASLRHWLLRCRHCYYAMPLLTYCHAADIDISLIAIFAIITSHCPPFISCRHATLIRHYWLIRAFFAVSLFRHFAAIGHFAISFRFNIMSWFSDYSLAELTPFRRCHYAISFHCQPLTAFITPLTSMPAIDTPLLLYHYFAEAITPFLRFIFMLMLPPLIDTTLSLMLLSFSLHFHFHYWL